MQLTHYFSWNHSLTLNISGSNKDIFENEAPKIQEDFLFLNMHFFFYFDNQFGLRQQIRMFFFKSCIFMKYGYISHWK